MSLVITSSKQQEYDGTAGVGIEKPFSYKNHMKSPLMIKANSEIAVVSVLADRDLSIRITKRGGRMGLYWGDEDYPDELDTGPNSVVYLEVPEGEYTSSGFARELQTQMNKICRQTFSNFGTAKVELITDAGDPFQSYKITFTQNASATDISGTFGSASFVACINDNNINPATPEIEAVYPGPYGKTDDFTITGNKITAGAQPEQCVAIMASTYLSSCSGVAEFDFSLAQGNIKVGLVRNIPKDRSAPANFNNIAQNPQQRDTPGNFLDEFYDYVFTIERDSAGGATEPSAFSVGQAAIVQTSSQGVQMVEVPSASYSNAVPNGSFDTSKGTFFNKVRFVRFGESIQVRLVDNKGGVTTLIESNSGALRPCGQACDLLYPKVEITEPTQAISITDFDAGVLAADYRSYTDDRFYGYENAFDSSQLDAAAKALLVSDRVDEITTDYAGRGVVEASIGYKPNPLAVSSKNTQDTINGSGGQARSWVMCLGPDQKYLTNIFFEMIPNNNMMRKLGFDHTPIIESVDKDAASTTNTIIFKSNVKPDSSLFDNMFIRWKPTQQQSYNAAQGTISKIIYACPRYDVRGNDHGALYYEPNERVYVDCNNPEPLMITDISVDLVDVNEVLAEGLVGNTQIVFHIRQKEDFKVGRDSGRT